MLHGKEADFPEPEMVLMGGQVVMPGGMDMQAQAAPGDVERFKAKLTLHSKEKKTV